MRSWNVVNATRAESCFPFLFSFFFWNRPLNGQRRGLLHRNRIDRVLFAVSSATITSALPALSCGIKEPIHFGRMRPPAPSDPAIAHVESIKTRSTEKTEEPPELFVVRLFRKQAAGGTKSNSGTRSRIPPRFSTRPAAVFRCCFVDGFFFFCWFWLAQHRRCCCVRQKCFTRIPGLQVLPFLGMQFERRISLHLCWCRDREDSLK